MAQIDVEQVVKKMLVAAESSLKGQQWNVVDGYAETEFRKFVETISGINKSKERGKITEKEASILVDMQKNAMRTVLTAVEGIGAVAAQTAINAALGVVRDVLNKAVGWTIV